MRLRQVATAARELEPVAEDFCEVLGIEVGYRDPGVGHFGLENVVMPIGETFLEVVSPKEEGTTAGRYLERKGADAGYMVILQTRGDMEEFRRRVEGDGFRIVWKGDHEDIKGTHLHPRDVGGAILSVDWAEPWESWRWAGPEWRDKMTTERVTAIRGVGLRAVDPATMAQTWARALGETATETEDGWRIGLEDSWIDFRPVEGEVAEGVDRIDVQAADGVAVFAAAAERGLPLGDVWVGIGGIEVHLLA